MPVNALGYYPDDPSWPPRPQRPGLPAVPGGLPARPGGLTPYTFDGTMQYGPPGGYPPSAGQLEPPTLDLRANPPQAIPDMVRNALFGNPGETTYLNPPGQGGFTVEGGPGGPRVIPAGPGMPPGLSLMGAAASTAPLIAEWLRRSPQSPAGGPPDVGHGDAPAPVMPPGGWPPAPNFARPEGPVPRTYPMWPTPPRPAAAAPSQPAATSTAAPSQPARPYTPTPKPKSPAPSSGLGYYRAAPGSARQAQYVPYAAGDPRIFRG